ncbi:GDSL Lipase/Acylhydrolase family protein [Thermoascus aurantiacus ATCC 26904]
MSESVDAVSFQPYDQFILFGDSITQFSVSQEGEFGFNSALQDAYIRRLDVINRGFGGYNTAHAVKVFPKFFPAPQIARVRFLMIFFGANDAVLPGFDQHVPLNEYEENLKAIVKHPAMLAQNPRILLLTPPPVNEYQLATLDAQKGFPTPSRTASNTKLYADACREVAASLGVQVVDIWTAFMKAAGWQEGQPLPGSKDIPNNEVLESLLSDGLHFTPEGYKIMYTEVMKVIRATWPDQAPENLPMIFPRWQEAPK